MDRFYLSPENWTGDTLQVSGEEGHHAIRVMRKSVGDSVEVFDGVGRRAQGEITETGKSFFVMAISCQGEEPSTPAPITLAVAMTKGKTMDLIVQKAVELGVSHIQPLATTNTVVKLSGKEREEKTAKWQRVALEACKQCGQNFLPEVVPVASLAAYLESEPSGHRLIASLAPGTKGLREHLAHLDTTLPVHLLIGPEGDFTPQEISEALAAAFQPVTLGEIVLRVETACLFLISAVRYQVGK